ncbi:3'(2'),5'-bisphosphate nucleotidase CysQ [Pontiella sp.]|uniref:3'(2'),5'-bisphosphate nucleotidase CysQ n=1 Tax=Pontiella sp. TaxID=2837462 RepID=UPI00356A4221
MIETAIQAALKAGQAILEIYAKDFEVEFKADESPLTSADKAAHHIIVEALASTPYPVLSEESAEVGFEERCGWTKYWLVDPLDGTKEFIKKNGEFTVNIALIEDGVPVAGVVYVPVKDTLYVGSGKGAQKATECAGKSVEEILATAAVCSVSGQAQTPLRVVASKSHCNDETRRFIAELEAEFGAVDLVSSGSSLKLCMVAEGSADLYPRIAPTMEWDTAAAHAVVAAAGGRVFQYDETVAAVGYRTGTDAVADVAYNKENLLNPYFVVTGLR